MKKEIKIIAALAVTALVSPEGLVTTEQSFPSEIFVLEGQFPEEGIIFTLDQDNQPLPSNEATHPVTPIADLPRKPEIPEQNSTLNVRKLK